ncbi:hypothetical protein SNOG_02886 [Parastagonospora nodorum SN15]|uniref:DUF3824 domain-containing protein n=1 Tax=Phaeosphaeria nodorum (strain SN15 / ATCC MYA-4574 / FGSC 10173) TaxID=321614 RepID=Q0UZC8_PHANO|nr:hypothetical protein SNOG_02886 [Parastagonospora nodorum SN15]EAT89617.2 hypothetical protein SNOG_02886 [Parastagonospora nodorum SN15]
MSVIYKEREREREWDTASRGGAQSYTTVRRYKVPDHSLEADTYEAEMRMVHRGGRSDFDDRRSTTTKDYVVEREVDRDVREYRYQDRSPSPRGRDVRDYHIQRSVVHERSPSPARTVREVRIERDYERDIPQHRDDQYSLEKYSRDIEYYREPPPPPPPQQQQQPQSIYIRNEAPPQQMQMAPIIIREEAPQPIIIREREPAYELIERSEVQQERQVARPRHEEDYYYERRVKEVDRGGRHEERYMDEREYGRDRYGDRNYYSDDDVVYVHKEKDTWGSETKTKRDVAAGALAGIAAGQIVRHHRKRKGEAAGGSIGNALGYGTLGAVSAVALDKYNNRTRSRSVSSDRGRRRHHSQGRARSKSRVREIGALAAIAGVGALAYAAGRKNKDKGVTTVVEEHRHRSRSRKSRSKRGHSRRGRSRSVTVIETDGGPSRSRSRSTSKHMDPKHRNNRVAQVGLASAAVAGLAARKRSKSRQREGKRSRSRVREGVPIAAAGVTGAAITGLQGDITVEVKVKIKVLRVWLLTRQPNGEIARRLRRNAINDVSLPTANIETSCTESSPGDEDSAYSTGSYSPYDSPRPSTTSTSHPNDSRFFPESNYFPPPPTAPIDHQAPYPPYNPADYPPPPSTTFEPSHPSTYVHPPHDDINHGNPYAPPQHQSNYYYGQPRRPDDNVSAFAPVAAKTEHSFASARVRSEKTVQFDLTPKGPSREVSPVRSEGEHKHRRRRNDDDRSEDSARESGRHRKRRHRDRDESPASDASDQTIDLPPRFDDLGRKRPEDPLAEKLESVLQSIFR